MLGSAGAAAGETRVSMLLLVITCSEPKYPNGRLGPLPMDTRAVGTRGERALYVFFWDMHGFMGRREK